MMTDQDEQLSLNDVTDYGLCFACGPRNPYGLKLHIEREGDKVVAKFTAPEEYQGYPGFLHGGIITALLDEVMSRVSIITYTRWTITGGIDVHFRKNEWLRQRQNCFCRTGRQRRGQLAGSSSCRRRDSRR